MPLSRTYYNTLVNDAGSGNGTLIDKNFIDAIYDDVDAALTALPINVKDPAYGAVGNGVTDDSAAIDAAIAACSAYSTLVFPAGTYLVSATVTLTVDYVTVRGPGVIKAKNSTNFTPVLSGSGRTGVVLQDIEIDCNKAGRASGQSTTFDGVAFPTSVDCICRNVVVRNTLGYSSSSATSLSASGATRFIADSCRIFDAGSSATSLPSDGFFVRGDGCKIVNCTVYRCTDTAYVLEGCNYSQINGSVAIDCPVVGAISNDTAVDCVGNQVNGLTGYSSYVGSVGGLFELLCVGAGHLRETQINGLTLRIATAAANGGPAMQVRHTSTGRVIGASINHPSIDSGGSSTIVAQGILISNCDDVQITDPYIRLDAAAQACIRFDGACVNGMVKDGYLTGADYGVLGKDTSAITVQATNVKGQDLYGIYAADTSTITALFNTITGAGTASSGKDAGGTLSLIDYNDVGTPWASWTPTYSSDLGNAATTFSGGTVTTTRARYRRQGKTAFVIINFSATLNAVTPQQLRLTLPAGYSPPDNNSYSTTCVLNDTTFETGMIRTLTGTDQLVIYRANQANFGSAKAVQAMVSWDFEIT